MLSERPASTHQVARRAAEAIRERLPSGWTLSEVEGQPFDQGVDLLVELASPDGRRVSVLIEAKRTIERREIPSLQRQLERWTQTPAPVVGVIAAGYLSPQTRGELSERHLSYVDATGNIELVVSEPGLYLRDVGAQSDPWRGAGRPRGTLKGDPAGRIVRALIDYDRQWKVTDLVKLAKASVGATYRAVDYLEQEGLVSARNGSAVFEVPDWRNLLVAWSADYNTFEVNRVTRWFEPRGTNVFLDRLANDVSGSEYAVTGSVAASEWAPFAPVRSVFVYTTNTELAAERWRLRATDASPNVLLIEPKNNQDIALVNTSRRADGLTLASPAQVAVDLLNGPGRNPSEAEELLTWMERNESQWRKQ